MMTSTANGDPTATETAAAVALPILEYGRGWMAAETTGARAIELGFEPPFGLWVNGRAGVLGPVDADVAAAAIGFMAPERVRTYWESRPATMTPIEATEAYADAAAVWGRSALEGLDDGDLDRLGQLSQRVAAAALPSVGAIFAGWRAIDPPSDPAGRATVVLNVLREMRGGAHLSAVHAVGLDPHGAILSADDPVRGGPAGAERFGWPEPHPEPDRERRAAAEAMTTTICAPAFEALDPAERSELIELVRAARACLDG